MTSSKEGKWAHFSRVKTRLSLSFYKTKSIQPSLGRGDDRHIRSDHRIVTDIDLSVIYKGRVKVNIYVLPQMDMPAAPHGMMGSLDICILADFGKQLF